MKSEEKKTSTFNFNKFRAVLIFFLPCIIVYLSFRFLLPLVFPFIIAYLLFRMLSPSIYALTNRFHFPYWISCLVILTSFWIIVSGVSLLIIWQFFQKLHLLLANYPAYLKIYGSLLYKQMQHLCEYVDYFCSFSPDTTIHFLLKQYEQFQANALHLLRNSAANYVFSSCSLFFRFFAFIMIIMIGMILLCQDAKKEGHSFKKNALYPSIRKILKIMQRGGLGYLKAQCIIIAVVWLICTISLWLIKNPYGIILGFFIAIFDAFPILGSGLILVPWGLFLLFQNKITAGIILFLAYLLTMLSREFLEAKLLANGMNIPSFIMLALIFIGIKLFGIAGIFLGPLGGMIIWSYWTSNKSV